MKITLRTLTPLWTGGVDGTTDRLHETAIIGNLRWWYEALVRGLGGYACDPTGEGRCEYNPKDPRPPEKQLCPVCYLFGATGWGRKFRLQVIGQPKIVTIKGKLRAIEAGQSILLELIPLRNIKEEEWRLLQLTMRLVSEYGAIGGKTVFKPSDEPGREDEFHHLDFGLVSITLPPDWPGTSLSLDDLKAYLTDERWRSGKHQYKDKQGVHDYAWASLQNFWCVKGRYLARQDWRESTFNRVITRKEPKAQAKEAENKWLAGTQQKSKKVFSFRRPARTFGFVKPGLIDFDEMRQRLKHAWPDFEPEKEFLTGEQILHILTSSGGAS